jgi:ABC-2 type transport system permease protein
VGAVAGRTSAAHAFLRIVRGTLLKGNEWAEVWPNLSPILLFLLVMAVVALRRYRQTLD